MIAIEIFNEILEFMVITTNDRHFTLIDEPFHTLLSIFRLWQYTQPFCSNLFWRHAHGC